MTTPLARSVHKPKQTIRRWLPQRRDDSGLTTLEWLLIVAAVAGLAALAVVLVQRVVGDTSEQIAGSSARKTAAQIAAAEVQAAADRDSASQPDDAKTYGPWASYYTTRCNRIKITYSDVADIAVTPNFTFATVVSTADVTEAAITPGSVTATANTAVPTSGGIAECRIP